MKNTLGIFLTWICIGIQIIGLNAQGFVSGRVYRIQSAVTPNPLIDLVNWGTTNGNNIITLAGNSATAQEWRVNQETEGFRIATIVNNNPSQCLPVVEKNPSTNEVYIYCFWGGRIQQWSSIVVGTVAGTAGTLEYAIRNIQANCVLQNNGAGARITCVNFDPNNVPASQRWRLLPGLYG